MKLDFGWGAHNYMYRYQIVVLCPEMYIVVLTNGPNKLNFTKKLERVWVERDY